MPLGLAVGEEIGDIPIDESLEGAAKKAEIKKSRATRAQMLFDMMKSDYDAIKGFEQ